MLLSVNQILKKWMVQLIITKHHMQLHLKSDLLLMLEMLKEMSISTETGKIHI